jgi:mannose-6-phosphate isomerase-like protein (cupin superfamily)
MTDGRSLPEKTHIGSKARQLFEPYTGAEIAMVDDFGLSVFLCQGTIAWHRHIDEDEMFLVYTGAMTIDSEMSPVFLRAGELTVVPKGVRHRSSSLTRTEVIIFQQRLLADRQNGHRRLYAVDEEGALSKVNIYATALDIPRPFVPHRIVQVGDFDVNLTVCVGTSGERLNMRWATLLLCQQGDITIDTSLGEVQLFVGDTVVIPPGVSFSVSAEKRALLLELSRMDK